MPTAKAWYYPNGPDKAVVEVDLGYALQNLAPRVEVVGAVPLAASGLPWPVIHRAGLRTTFRRERVSSATLRAALTALVNHLQRGGTVAIALDASKAWSGVVTGAGRDAGDIVLVTAGNSLAEEAPAAVLAAGDVVWVESTTPEWRREIATVLSVSGNEITLTSGVIYDRDADVGMVIRHEHCYPVLFLPEDQLEQDFFTEDGRLWTFEAELQVHPATYDAEVARVGMLGMGVHAAGVLGAIGSILKTTTSGPTYRNPSSLGNLNR